MASEFITRVEHDKDEPYTVIFRTDDVEKYKHIEDECRKMIGHAKPTVDAVPVEWIKEQIERLKPQDNVFASLTAGMIDAMLTDYCADGERRTE